MEKWSCCEKRITSWKVSNRGREGKDKVDCSVTLLLATISLKIFPISLSKRHHIPVEVYDAIFQNILFRFKKTPESCNLFYHKKIISDKNVFVVRENQSEFDVLFSTFIFLSVQLF